MSLTYVTYEDNNGTGTFGGITTTASRSFTAGQLVVVLWSAENDYPGVGTTSIANSGTAQTWNNLATVYLGDYCFVRGWWCVMNTSQSMTITCDSTNQVSCSAVIHTIIHDGQHATTPIPSGKIYSGTDADGDVSQAITPTNLGSCLWLYAADWAAGDSMVAAANCTRENYYPHGDFDAALIRPTTQPRTDSTAFTIGETDTAGKISWIAFEVQAQPVPDLPVHNNTTVATGVTNSSSGTYTFSHTVNEGVNRYLVVGVTLNNQVAESTGVTFNGDALTKLDSIQNGSYEIVEYWWMVAPDVGTYNVVIDYGGAGPVNIAAVATAYNEVDQFVPHGTKVTNTGTSTGPTVSVPSSVMQLVVAVHGQIDATGSAIGAGQTLRGYGDSSGTTDSWVAISDENGPATVVMSATSSASQPWVAIGVPLRRAAVNYIPGSVASNGAITSSATITVTMPAACASGDVILAVASCSGSQNINSISSSNCSWSLVHTFNHAGNNQDFALWRGKVTTGFSASTEVITVTYSASTSYRQIEVIAYTPGNGKRFASEPVQQSNSVTYDGGASPTTVDGYVTTLTTTGTNSFVIVGCMAIEDGTPNGLPAPGTGLELRGTIHGMFGETGSPPAHPFFWVDRTQESAGAVTVYGSRLEANDYGSSLVAVALELEDAPILGDLRASAQRYLHLLVR